ncbi:MAG TPA: type II secretion system F family protein [Acidobacteriaceae bacterium]|jgi:type IV pilus assembly protein PilC|nr:type II secretion system F family protein [Acidobacteriaceae bacterium]
MAEFTVRLGDERGRISEQVHAAASAEELRQRFSQAGFYVYSVRQKGFAGTGVGGRRKVKLEAFLIFNAQFLTLIRAGLPIPNSLASLARQQKNENFRAQIENVVQRIRTGESLSSAFQAQGGFPVIYITTLLAGERSGQLIESLERYVSFQRITLTFSKKLKASLYYPALLIVMMTGLFIFLISFVVPRFAALYEQIGNKLPGITLFLLGIGNDVQHYGLYAVPIIAAIVFFALRGLRTERGRRWLDGVRLRLPLFGNIWLKYQVALFSRTLSTLLSGGLPLVPALETAARSIDSPRLTDATEAAVTTVREGTSLASSLEAQKIFPQLSIEMIEVGESTGALPAMLNSGAEFFEEDVQTALTAALSLIEPAILIFMGLVVVFILLALYLPIFTLGATQAS